MHIANIDIEIFSSKNSAYLPRLGKYFSSDSRTPSANIIGIPAGTKCPPIVSSLSFDTLAAKGAVILYRNVSSSTCHV